MSSSCGAAHDVGILVVLHPVCGLLFLVFLFICDCTLLHVKFPL